MADDAQEIIDGAWRKGRVTTPTSTQQANGLLALNNMLTSWSAEGLLLYQRTEETHTLVVGTATYTWGSGGDINTARPILVRDAFIRDSNSIDYPLEVNMSMKEYNRISDKTTSGRPTKMYLASEFSLAKIKFNYAPESAETLYLYSDKHLTEFAALGTSFAFPPEYKRALIYNLAVELAPEEDLQLPPEVFAIALQSKKTLERINIKPVNPVTMPSELFYGTRGQYNINSG